LGEIAHLAVALHQGVEQVGKVLLVTVVIKGDSEFIVVPSEPAVIEVDDLYSVVVDEYVGYREN
jgi:hypothetical protein